MDRSRAADDFATIRARMEELRHERERVEDAEKAMTSERVPGRADRIVHVAIPVRRLNTSAG
jgi:hypothetical protein